MEVSYTDNSHLLKEGNPIRIWEEVHCSLTAKRSEVIELLPKLRHILGKDVEIHINYEEEVEPISGIER